MEATKDMFSLVPGKELVELLGFLKFSSKVVYLVYLQFPVFREELQGLFGEVFNMFFEVSWSICRTNCLVKIFKNHFQIL